MNFRILLHELEAHLIIGNEQIKSMKQTIVNLSIVKQVKISGNR